MGLCRSLGLGGFKEGDTSKTRALRSDVPGTREDAHEVGEEEVREGLGERQWRTVEVM